jgi:hypothetical protein
MEKGEFKKLIEVSVAKVVREKVDNLDRIVDDLVKQAICSLLGIEYRWGGRAEIDHCNGRNSILTKVIEERAKEQVEKIVKSFKIDANDKYVESAFKKEYHQQLQNQLKYYAEGTAKSMAEKVISNYTEKELEKIGFEKIEKK